MAGYAGLVSVGQQAYVGFGGYMLFRADHLRRASPACRRSPLAGGCWRHSIAVPVAALIFRLRGRLFRHRHLGHGRGVPAVLRAGLRARRRLGIVAAGGHRQVDGRVDATCARRSATGWRLALAVVGDRCGRICVLRSRRGPGADRDPRQRTRRPKASASTSGARSSWSMSSPRA